MAEGDTPSSSDKRSDFIAGALHRPTRGPTITELRCCLVAFAWVRGRWANARRRVPGKNAPAYGAGGEASARAFFVPVAAFSRPALAGGAVGGERDQIVQFCLSQPSLGARN